MREENPLWDSLMLACYGELTPNLTKSERGRCNAALKELREVNATPEDITLRAKRYPKIMPPGCALTASALAANWARCAPQIQKKREVETYRPPQGKATPEGYRAAIECLPASLQRRLKLKHEG